MLKLYVKAMSAKSFKEIKDDVEGASLIEYSLLIGLISAAVVATIVLVGGKILPYWVNLNTAMP